MMSLKAQVKANIGSQGESKAAELQTLHALIQ